MPENTHSDKPNQLPLFDSAEPEATDVESVDTVEAYAPTREDNDRRVAVSLARVAEVEYGPKSFPEDEAGLYAVDAIEPGMYNNVWGAVKGKVAPNQQLSDKDITIASREIPRSQRALLAAREFARLSNARIAAIREGRDIDAHALDTKITTWLKHSLENKWRNPSTPVPGASPYVELPPNPEGTTLSDETIETGRRGLAQIAEAQADAEINGVQLDMDEMFEQPDTRHSQAQIDRNRAQMARVRAEMEERRRNRQ